jgi:hypothetical protein
MTNDCDPSAALAELDRVGRRAASALLAAVDAASDAAPAAPAAPAARAPRRRRAWLAAAAAVLVLVVGALVVVRATDDRLDFSSGGVEYLVPGWLPDGWAPRWPYFDGMHEHPSDFEGDMAVYGDGRVDDPWTGSPILTVRHIDGGPYGLPELPEGEPVTVGGVDGVLAHADGQWTATTGELVVTGDGTTREQVVSAAARATDQPAIGAGGLPTGFREIARGAIGATGNVEAVERGVAVEYGVEGVSSTDMNPESAYRIVVLQQPGDAGAVDLVREPDDGARYTTVRGQRAVILTGESSMQVGDDPPVPLPHVTLQWLEPSGTLVKVLSEGVPQDEVILFAESLRPADQAETQDLVSTYGVEHGRPVDADALDE